MPPTPVPPAAPTVSAYVEAMDTVAARTQRLCTDLPHQQAVRTTLLRAEKNVHVTEGWDSRPRVFTLNRHVKTDRVTYVEVPTWSAALVASPTGVDGVMLMVSPPRPRPRAWSRHGPTPNAATPSVKRAV